MEVTTIGTMAVEVLVEVMEIIMEEEEVEVSTGTLVAIGSTKL
jgi:hypothetical protein